MRNDLKSFDEGIEKSNKNMMSGDVTPVDWLRWGIHLIFYQILVNLGWFVKQYLICIARLPRFPNIINMASRQITCNN